MTRLTLVLTALLLVSGAEAQTRWHPQGTSSCIQIADAQGNFICTTGAARGDGKVATDCAITVNTAILTCATSAPFSGGDVSKVIAVYDAGPLLNTFRQPLSTTIAGYTSAAQVTLGATASATANPSSRVVWGTDNTTLLQAAVDALAVPNGVGGNLGGTILLPPGRFLTHGINLPCAKIGSFATGICLKTYNNITLQGSGRDVTALENWDIATSFSGVNGVTGNAGLITLGLNAEAPTVEAGNDRLKNILIADLSLIQIQKATNSIKTLNVYATDGVRVTRTYFEGPYECLYTAGGIKSYRMYVHDNVFRNCGNGGPVGSGFALAAINVNGVDMIVYDNDVANSGQGIESGSIRAIIQHNKIDCPTNLGITVYGINIGSTGSGIWGNVVRDNRVSNCASSGLVHANGIGTLNRTYILNNQFVDSLIAVGAGLEVNTVLEGELDTVVHGMSVIDGNRFSFGATRPVSPVITIGQLATPQQGLESWQVTNNAITFQTTYGDATPFSVCQEDADVTPASCSIPVGALALAGPYGGGARWLRSTAYALNAYVVPRVENNHYYIATVAGTSGTTEPIWPTTIGGTIVDGGVTWKNNGKRPTVTVKNLSVQGPAGAKNTGQNDLVHYNTGDRRVLKAAGVTFSYPWNWQASGADDGFAESVPASAVWGDTNRWASAKPTAGIFRLGDFVNNQVPVAGTLGWTAIRAGQAAPAWLATTAYAFGAAVVPATDNAHYYRQTNAACTSGGSTPTFPTGAGASVADNTCNWQESGAAALFTP